MIFVGIDPGKKGAIGFIFPWTQRVTVRPMPILPAGVLNGKRRGRDEYDLTDIRTILRGLEHSADYDISPRGIFVTVEKSQPMPPTVKGGTVANFNRGVCRGWEWMLVALQISYQLVAPVTWQRQMHAGTPGADTKQRSLIAAKRLFPDVSLKRTERSRKDDDGCADAILLADFGRRTYEAPAEENEKMKSQIAPKSFRGEGPCPRCGRNHVWFRPGTSDWYC